MTSSGQTPSSTSDADASRAARPLTPAPADPAPATGADFWALGAGAVAALVSWLLIEATLDSFKPKGTATRFMTSTYLIPGAQERATADPGTRYWPWD